MKCIAIICIVLGYVQGHGRLLQPPSRASMWRFGFDNPRDDTDNEGNCGGRSLGGKCGICGDAYDAQVKDHEAPYGKYANGIIVETYHSGEIIPVSIQITANHKGKFYFHLCPNDNIHQDPTEDCFETTPLSIYPSGESSYVLPDQMSRTYTFQLKLPKDLTCQQCILRWTYRTGNHWGYEKGNPKGCLGCGPQEFFKACSDIRIIKGNGTQIMPRLPQRPIPTESSNLPKPRLISTLTTLTPKGSSKVTSCQATNPFKSLEGIENWCLTNCNHGFCPDFICDCQ